MCKSDDESLHDVFFRWYSSRSPIYSFGFAMRIFFAAASLFYESKHCVVGPPIKRFLNQRPCRAIDWLTFLPPLSSPLTLSSSFLPPPPHCVIGRWHRVIVFFGAAHPQHHMWLRTIMNVWMSTATLRHTFSPKNQSIMCQSSQQVSFSCQRSVCWCHHHHHFDSERPVAHAGQVRWLQRSLTAKQNKRSSSK